jgi:hypothetical protein
VAAATAGAAGAAGAGDPEGADLQPGDPGWMPDEPAMPLWLETSFPWMVSFTLHLGILLLVVAMFYFVGKKKANEDDAKDAIIPTGDPAEIDDGKAKGSPNPGVANQTTEASQNKFNEVSDGWSETKSDADNNGAFGGEESNNNLTAIMGRGQGGKLGAGNSGLGTGEGGPLAPYGPNRGGGSGAGPKGMWGHGTMAPGGIVYVLDHSGSMIDTFDFLREEVKKSLSGLGPRHKFSVVMFSEKVDATFPEDGSGLRIASPDAKRELNNFVDNVRAAGKNDDLYEPFAEGLRKAFAMKPNIIYFLTDGNFDPKVVDEARRLNQAAGNKVRIHTLAFIRVSKEAEKALETIATDSNKGTFKFVTMQDLGK